MARILPIGGSPGYFISDQGDVFGPRGKMKCSVLQGQGYIYVTIGGRRARVHTLVLEAFVGPRPPGLVTLHANDIRNDNRLENLSWGTLTQNSQDCVRRGRHKKTQIATCPMGHEYTPENTYIRGRGVNGHRECRTCLRQWQADQRARQLADDPEFYKHKHKRYPPTLEQKTRKVELQRIRRRAKAGAS